jgi:hypothetical protein
MPREWKTQYWGFIVTLALALEAQAGQWPLSVPKGTTVVLKVPMSAMSLEGHSAGGALIYAVEVERILSQASWRKVWFPLMQDFRLEKVTDWKAPTGVRYTQVEIRNAMVWAKLRFNRSADLNAQFLDVVAIGDVQAFKESEYFRKEVFEPLDPEIFVGPLVGLPYNVKLGLLDFVDYRKDALTAGTYKGKTYVSVDLGEDGNVYNSLRLDEAARVALVENERLLKLIKTFSTVAEMSGIDGVKLIAVISYKSFLDELARPSRDVLQLYVPLDLARRFQDADITSQQLIDGSVVLLNDNRIQVSLAAGPS